MAVKIRLRRVGAKKQPTYRLVVADEKKARNGAFIENIGHYNPRTEPPTIVINEERALHWLKNGAQPTESVASLLKRNKTLEKFEQMKKGVTEQTAIPETEAPPQVQ